MLKVSDDNTPEFGCWVEAPDGTRVHLTTVCMAKLMEDLELTWLQFFSRGFDGVLRDDQ